MKFIRALIHGDEGASMVEYAIGVGFIAAALVIAAGIFTGKLSSAFGRAGSHLDATP